MVRGRSAPRSASRSCRSGPTSARRCCARCATTASCACSRTATSPATASRSSSSASARRCRAGRRRSRCARVRRCSRPRCTFAPGRDHLGVVRPPVEVQRLGRLREDIARITQALAHEFEDLIRARARAVAPAAAELAERPCEIGRTVAYEASTCVRVVMMSPYSLLAARRRAGPGARPRARAAQARRRRARRRSVRRPAARAGRSSRVGPSVEWNSNGSVAPISPGPRDRAPHRRGAAQHRARRRAPARARGARPVPERADRVQRPDGRDVPRVG